VLLYFLWIIGTEQVLFKKNLLPIAFHLDRFKHQLPTSEELRRSRDITSAQADIPWAINIL
jgi:hypothetical protein